MKFSLVTPEKKIFTDLEIEEAIVPGERGELNILPGHAPLVTTLQAGSLRYRKKGAPEFESAAVSWGYAEVNPEGINVLADTAEVPAEIDIDRAKRSFQRAQERLQEAGLAPEDYQQLQRKVEKARVRLDVAGKA